MPKEIILKVIHLCLESGLKVLINTTISNTNFTNIERMCEEAISIGATAIRFTNFLKQGNVLKNSIEEYALSRDEVNLFFEQLNRMRKNTIPKHYISIEVDYLMLTFVIETLILFVQLDGMM